MSRSISRRRFTKLAAGSALFITINPVAVMKHKKNMPDKVRLGAPLFKQYNNPDEWIMDLKALNYKAAYCPLDLSAGNEEIKAYREAAEKGDIIISEVGVWNNPISPDEEERNAAIEKCIKSLQLADDIGAKCCVNVSGSRNKDRWAGPHKDNLTDITFDMVVETTREIIDAVNPIRTWFTLEAMPWAFPHTPDAYVRLLKAIDRERFAVHLDPVNMVTSPEIYFNNGEMIKECFKKLGPYIKSCHAKDIILREDIYTTHLDEVRPGLGSLRYDIFLKEMSKLQDVPLMMEHLRTPEEYKLAAGYIREVGKKNGVTI